MSCARNWLALGDGDVPIVVELMDCTRPYPLVGNEEVLLTFTSPSGQSFTRPGTVSLPNKAEYIAQADDFDEAGTWTVSALVTFASGMTRRSPCPASFVVKA